MMTFDSPKARRNEGTVGVAIERRRFAGDGSSGEELEEEPLPLSFA